MQHFYARDVMLARILATTRLCLSQVGVLYDLTARIELVFRHEGFFRLHPAVCFNEIPYKNDGILPLELSSRKMDARSVINWTVVGQLS